MWQCYYCRLPLSLEMQIKNRMCPNCGSDVHACKNCVHYDENLSSRCDEPNSEWVADRGVQNSCSFFEFRRSNPSAPQTKSGDHSSDAERAKEAFRALFRTA